MNFLRSVISDARPRKPVVEPSAAPSEIAGRKAGRIERDAFGGKKQPPIAADPAGGWSTPLPNPERTGDLMVSQDLTFQVDDLANDRIRDVGSNAAPEQPMFMPAVTPAPVQDEAASTTHDMADPRDPEPYTEDEAAPGANVAVPRQPDETTTPESSDTPRNLRPYDPFIDHPEPRDVQHQVSDNEETEPLPPPINLRDLLTEEFQQEDGASALQPEKASEPPGGDLTVPLPPDRPAPAPGEKETEPVAKVLHPSEIISSDLNRPTPPVDGVLESDSGPSPPRLPITPSSPAENHGREQAPDAEKNPIEPPLPARQPDLTGPTPQTKILRLQTPSNAPGKLRDASDISGKALTVDAPAPPVPDRAEDPGSKIAAVSTPAGTTKPTSPESKGPPLPKDRPATPEPKSKPLRSAPAKPIQPESMPPGGDTLPSRHPLRPTGKTPASLRVQIGQIDVIIESTAPSPAKPAQAPAPSDVAGRHYLRRL